MAIIDILKEINLSKKEFQVLTSGLRKYIKIEKENLDNFEVLDLSKEQFKELSSKQDFLQKMEEYIDYTARHFKGWESLMKDFITSAKVVNDAERYSMLLEMYQDLWHRHWGLYEEKFGKLVGDVKKVDNENDLKGKLE